MRITQDLLTAPHGWQGALNGDVAEAAQLAFVFGNRALLAQPELLEHIVAACPQAQLIGCSTAGEIQATRVYDESLTVTAVEFAHTKVKVAGITLAQNDSSRQIGERLIQSIPMDGLVHVFVLSDGLNVNGSELVEGIGRFLPEGIAVTGGLSGDGDLFQTTLVLLDNEAKTNTITIVGFYGDRLKVGYGSLGGWDPFGPERLITKADGNRLYELDGQSALELYKKYLGEHAEGLPATGLLFPLTLRSQEGRPGLVRTILSVDEATQSMIFAGDMPEGAYARLMKANFNRLIDGAAGAAKTSYEAIGAKSPDLAVLISCVGRKMVLKQRVEDEVEAVQEILGEATALTGFYSYGEISPFTPGAPCELHNQTMTITTFRES